MIHELKHLSAALMMAGILSHPTLRAEDPLVAPPPPPVEPLRLAGLDVTPPPPPPRPPAIDVDLERVADEVRRAQEMAAREAERAMSAMGEQLRGFRFGLAGPDVQRTLVVPREGASGESVREIREDLGVMSRILRKVASGEERGGQFRLGFGDKAWGRATDLDALYLDGHGAVFVVPVDQMLIPPPDDGSAAGHEAGPRDDVWERTRRELRGEPDIESRDRESGRAPRGASYDEARVTALRQGVIEALRHAVNIRALQSADRVTVLVQGRGPVIERREGRAMAGNGRERREETFVHRSGGLATLTLRATRADIVEFAEGRLDADGFAGRVKVEVRSEP